MSRILWHNIIIIITIFPGILLFLMNRFRLIRKFNEIDKYILCLSFVVIVNLLNNISYMCTVTVIILGSYMTFCVEYILTEKGKVDFNKFKYVMAKIKKPLYVMILFPIFEEYIYRYYVYSVMYTVVQNKIVYVFISTVTFTFVHFFNQNIKCFYKIPLSLLESIVFVIFKNIFICIIIHMCYNIYVYAYNSIKYNNQFGGFW